MKTTGFAADGSTTDADGRPVTRAVDFGGLPKTHIDWEVMPDDFADLLVRIGQDYPGIPLVITENGAAYDDVPDEDGFVDDEDRTGYIAAHVDAVARARQRGADIRGYFAWSLMDNFEWAYGYDKRFGIIRTDYQTQTRTPKRSALWLRDTIARARRPSGDD
jgi:beta-glucosidase